MDLRSLAKQKFLFSDVVPVNIVFGQEFGWEKREKHRNATYHIETLNPYADFQCDVKKIFFFWTSAYIKIIKMSFYIIVVTFKLGCTDLLGCTDECSIIFEN